MAVIHNLMQTNPQMLLNIGKGFRQFTLELDRMEKLDEIKVDFWRFFFPAVPRKIENITAR